MKKTINTLVKHISFVLYGILFSFPAYAGKECPNLEQYKIDGVESWTDGTGWMLGIYNLIRDVCSIVADQSWELFSPGLQAVIAVGAAIYIALRTLKNISSFSQQDVAAYFSNEKTGLFLLMFKAAGLILLLQNNDFVYQYLISPILIAGGTISSDGFGTEFETAADVRTLFNLVIDIAKNVNQQAYTIVAMGRLLLCMVWLPDGFLNWHWKMIPFGGATYIFGQLILLGISFYMMDILFRLGVGCMLLPMGIACGMSKLTSGYTKKLWNLFINVAFNFVILSIVINFTIEMIASALAGLAAGKVEVFLTGIVSEAAAEQMDKELTLGTFIIMALACLVAFKLFMDVEGITEKISSAKSVGKGAQKASAAVAKMAGNVAGAVAKQPGEFLKAAGKEAKATASNSKPVRSLRRGWNSFRNAGKRLVGLDDRNNQDRLGNWIKKQAKRLLRIP